MGIRRKSYVAGTRTDVRVPFCEVELDPPNEPVRLYDTSGPGSDPRAGLAAAAGRLDPRAGRRRALRRPGGDAARRRPGLVPAGRPARPPSRSRARAPTAPACGPAAGRTVTQMHYARRGEVTPEMEFVALREGMDAEFVRDEVARGPGHHPRQRQPPRVASR